MICCCDLHFRATVQKVHCALNNFRVGFLNFGGSIWRRRGRDDDMSHNQTWSVTRKQEYEWNILLATHVNNIMKIMNTNQNEVNSQNIASSINISISGYSSNQMQSYSPPQWLSSSLVCTGKLKRICTATQHRLKTLTTTLQHRHKEESWLVQRDNIQWDCDLLKYVSTCLT